MADLQEVKIEEKKMANLYADLKKYLSDFFKNKAVIWGIILTVVYIASGFYKWLEISVPVIAFFAFIFLPVQSGFCLFAYLMCFTRSNLDYYSMLLATTLCYTIVLAFKYLIGVKKKKYPIYFKLAITIILFTLVSSIISLLNMPVYFAGLTYLAYLPLFYCVLAMRKEFNINKAMQSLFLGVIISSLLSLAFGYIPYYEYAPFAGNRFVAFSNCANYFYMRVFVVLTYFMAKNLSKTLKFYKFCLIFAICAILIVATKSKTAIALLVFFTILYLIIFVCQDFKKRYILAIVFIAALALVGFLARNVILDIFERFKDGSGNWTLSSITSGRTEIWKEYLKRTIKSPASFFLGSGMFGEEPFVPTLGGSYDAHNAYIMLLYRFGIIGCGVIIYMICLFIKHSNKKHIKLVSALPLLWFLLESLADNTFKAINIFLLVLCFMALSSKETNEN